MKTIKQSELQGVGKITPNTLIQGDCLEVMSKMEDNSVDAVICDPPYGTTACKWDSVIPFEQMWEQLHRICKWREGSPIILFGSQPFTSNLIMSNVRNFKYEWIWEKSKSGSAFTAKYRPVCKHENVLVFGKGKHRTYNPQKIKGVPYSRKHKTSERGVNNHQIGLNKREIVTKNDGYRHPITVQKFQQKWRRQDQLHPTQKPITLMEYLIKTYTNEGDTVLDFTMGSGTTGVACKNLDRNFIGIEQDEKYFDISVERINS